MTREVHAIPPAPRAVRWSSVVWHRWPLALGGFALAVYGGLWTLMLFFASAGKPIDDARLDSDAVKTTGEALEIVPTFARIGDADADRVHFRFRTDGQERFGRSFAPRGLRPGEPVDVEYLAGADHVSRVAGGRISLVADLVTPAFWLTVAPGSMAALAWAFGVLRLRRLLVHGDVAAARIDTCEPVRFMVPLMLSVGFSFRDRRAAAQHGHHWVRERSSLGTRVRRGQTSLAVIHDRDDPTRYRLVVSDEFTATLQARGER